MSPEPARGIKRNPVSKNKGREEGERKETGVKTEHEFLKVAPFFAFVLIILILGVGTQRSKFHLGNLVNGITVCSHPCPSALLALERYTTGQEIGERTGRQEV